MVGFTESLNVSVSVAIILQQVSYTLRNSNINWHLSEEAFEIKTIDWYEKSIKNIESIRKAYQERF